MAGKMENLAAYKKIEEDILSRIRTGEWKTNFQIPTQNELAKDFYKVTRLTVSKAINRLIDRGCLYSIQGKGVYVKNTSPKKIAFLLPSSRLAIDYLEGILKKSADLSINTLIYNTAIEEESSLVCDILNSGIDGVIYYPRFENIMKGICKQTITRLKQAGVPVIILDRYWNDVECPYVISDFFQAGYIAGTKLLENGHRRICYIGAKTEEKIDSAKGRFNGFMEAVRDFGLHSKDVPAFDLSEEIVPQILKDFTGAFFLDDFSANSFIYLAEKINQNALDSFSIIGFGNIAATHSGRRKISSLDIMTKRSGETACEKLYKMISGLEVEAVTKVPVSWVQGETLKDIRKKNPVEISEELLYNSENQLNLKGGFGQ